VSCAKAPVVAFAGAVSPVIARPVSLSAGADADAGTGDEVEV
jgi:hypothetical protein